MAKDLVVPLAPNVWRIPLVRDLVNGFALRDDDGQVTLVDMGISRSGPKVLAALAAIGSSPSDVTRLVLTHAHPDHAGGARHGARFHGPPRRRGIRQRGDLATARPQLPARAALRPDGAARSRLRAGR